MLRRDLQESAAPNNLTRHAFTKFLFSEIYFLFLILENILLISFTPGNENTGNKLNETENRVVRLVKVRP